MASRLVAHDNESAGGKGVDNARTYIKQKLLVAEEQLPQKLKEKLQSFDHVGVKNPTKGESRKLEGVHGEVEAEAGKRKKFRRLQLVPSQVRDADDDS